MITFLEIQLYTLLYSIKKFIYLNRIFKKLMRVHFLYIFKENQIFIYIRGNKKFHRKGSHDNTFL